MIENTVIIIKPDAVRLRAIGSILEAIEAEGLSIYTMRMLWCTEDVVRALYAAHVDKPYWDAHARLMMSGRSVVALIQGENAVGRMRVLVGPTDPEVAYRTAPMSIRARFGTKLPENAIHASDSVDAVVNEARILGLPLEGREMSCVGAPCNQPNCIRCSARPVVAARPDSSAERSSSRAGFLVVFEGIHGSGKSTLARAVATRLRQREAETPRFVLSVCEPTRDRPFGKRIRRLAAVGRRTYGTEEELALFLCDRLEQNATVVRPALARGDIIVQDRNYASSVVHQSMRGLDPDFVLESSLRIAPIPDLFVLVDLPVEVAFARCAVRGERTYALTGDHKDVLDESRRLYLAFVARHAREAGAVTMIVDGTKSIDELVNEVIAVIP